MDSRFLTKDELRLSAFGDFERQINTGEFTQDQVSQFVDKNVIGASINGVKIINPNFEHSTRTVDPMLKAYIGAPNTRLVVAEYFFPSFREETPLSQIIKNVVKFKGEYEDRLVYAKNLGEVCHEAKKPVAAADIANFNSLFMVERYASRNAFVGLGALLSLYALSTHDAPESLRILAKSFDVAALISVVSNSILQHQLYADTGIFDREKINISDQITFDMEDARRVYMAKAVRQLVTEYTPSTSASEKKTPQMILMYPHAHGLRILNGAIHKPGIIGNIKDKAYLVMGAGLKHAVETWRPTFKNSETIFGEEADANWQLISNRPY